MVQKGRLPRARGAILSAGTFFALAGLASVVLLAATVWNEPAARYHIGVTAGLGEPLETTQDAFYAQRIQPVWDQHCVSCHRDGKAKGHLKLEHFHQPFIGGRSGPSILAEQSGDSIILQRMLLPAEDPLAMPPLGKSRPNTGDLTALAMWIDAGAEGSLPADALPDAPALVKPVEIARFDPSAVAQARGGTADAVAQLAERYPGLIQFAARDSTSLTLNANAIGQNFDDAVLGELRDLLPLVTYADLSGAPITRAALSDIAMLEAARVLRLERTDLGALRQDDLAALDELESLSVSSGVMSESDLAALRAKGLEIFVIGTGGDDE